MPDLGPAVRTIIERCLAVRPGEDVLVVADRGTRRIGEALRDAAAEAQAEAVLTIMDPREVDGNEPPRTVAGALAECDVFIAPTTRSLSHTMAVRSRAVAALLTEADTARVTCPRGTDFTLDLAGRTGLPDDGELAARG